MHPVITALLDLHDVNRKRMALARERRAVEAKLETAQKALAQMTTEADRLEGETRTSDALIRQYRSDVERCERVIRESREKQMQAKTNKEYLACVNAAEQAKSEKRLREESLKQLDTNVEVKRQAAQAALARRDEAAKALDSAKSEVAAGAERNAAEKQLDAIYQEKRNAVEPKFLETYERLVAANHRMPLMKVDPRTRATPYGQIIGTNQLEMIRLGHFVKDPQSNAILYVDE